MRSNGTGKTARQLRVTSLAFPASRVTTSRAYTTRNRRHPEPALERRNSGWEYVRRQGVLEGYGEGFTFTDKSASHSGVTSIKLHVASEQVEVLVGKGPNLGLPSLPFSQESKVTVQLIGNGICWGAAFSAPATKNDTASFLDKGD